MRFRSAAAGSWRAAAWAATALLLLSCGASVGQSPSRSLKLGDRIASIVVAAKTELELTLSWAPGFMDSPQELRKQIEGFNRFYGTSLRVTFKPGSPMRDSTAAVIQENALGIRSTSDVILGTETDISDLSRANVLTQEPWTSWATTITEARLVATGGVAVKVQTRIPGITYNSGKLKGAAVPRSLADLLKLELRGHVATTPHAERFDQLAGGELWGTERTMAYARKFVGQLSGVLNCGDEERVANGEFDAFAFDCGSARVAQLKAKGLLIGWTAPSDASLLGYLYMGIPRNAAHPNAARLWINYMLTREAQDAMYEFGFADLHLLAGSHTFAEVDAATKSGAKYYELSIEAVLVDSAKGARPVGRDIEALVRAAVPGKP